MKLLLDTSIIIDFTRRTDHQNSPLFKIAKKFDDFYISDITLAELYSGRQIWQQPNKMRLLEKILDRLQRLPTNEKICRLAGQFRAQTQISLMDSLIAATAINHQLSLTTLNEKDFSRITDLKLVLVS